MDVQDPGRSRRKDDVARPRRRLAAQAELAGRSGPEQDRDVGMPADGLQHDAGQALSKDLRHRQRADRTGGVGRGSIEVEGPGAVHCEADVSGRRVL